MALRFLADHCIPNTIVRALRDAAHEAPAVRHRSANKNIMKKKTEKRERRDQLRREYNLSKLKGGVRAK